MGAVGRHTEVFPARARVQNPQPPPRGRFSPGHSGVLVGREVRREVVRHHCGRHAVEHSLDRRSRLPLTAGGPLCVRPAGRTLERADVAA
ncbi:hypothetical protein ACWEQ2_29050, partial [Streptomyces sp. NPDC004096]